MNNKTATIIITGNEITRGIVQDKEIKAICHSLDERGLVVREVLIERDDMGMLEERITQSVQSNSLVITTGGLGPTADDKTRFCVAAACGVEAEQNETALANVMERCSVNIQNNIVQAMIPSGFSVMHNSFGTAPGFWGVSKGGCLVASLPGPPKEMFPMFEGEFKAVLDKYFPLTKNIGIDEYSLFGVKEADFEALCKEALSKTGLKGSVEIGTRFQDTKISVFIQGGTEEDRANVAAALTELIPSGQFVPGCLEVADCVVSRLTARGEKVATAESITGGFVAKLITDVAGASAVFVSGAVTYSDNAKHTMLGVKTETLAKYTAVSAETAHEMAQGTLKAFGSDWSVCTTGYAGPTGENVGLVYEAVGCAKSGKITVKELNYPPQMGREAIRRRSAVEALCLLHKELLEC